MPLKNLEFKWTSPWSLYLLFYGEAHTVIKQAFLWRFFDKSLGMFFFHRKKEGLFSVYIHRSFFCVCLKGIALHNCFYSFSFLHHFSGITQKYNGQKIFYRHCDRWYNSVIYFYKRKFSGPFFFLNTNCSKGEFPRDFLINVATCLFAYY